jgi:hypothetical protein
MPRKSVCFHFFVQVGKVTGEAVELDVRRVKGEASDYGH